jgi:ferric-dicitrate binding protein FerR (iron transport regulator)
VKIKLPGSDELFELEDGQQVPAGSTFDTSKGRVNLQAAGSQRAWFYQGVFSSATVPGTRWLVEDRCNGTLTRVTEGRVAVRDFVRKRTVIVRAGRQYLAKRRR